MSNKSSIYNICFSCETVVWPETGDKSAQIKHHLQEKNSGIKQMDYFTGGTDIMDFEHKWWIYFLHRFSSHKTWIL